MTHETPYATGLTMSEAMNHKQPNSRNARKIKTNKWDNIIAYVGHKKVWDFGLDDMSAKEWLALGCYCTSSSVTGWKAICPIHSISIDCPAPQISDEELHRLRNT